MKTAILRSSTPLTYSHTRLINMKKFIIFTILKFTFFCLIAQNQNHEVLSEANVLLVQTQQNRIRIEKEHIEIYKDSTNSLTFEEASSDNFVQFSSCSNYNERIKSNINYWLKFQIKNTSAQKGDWALEFQSVPFSYIFIIDKIGNVEKIRTGTSVPASEKQIKSGIRENIIFTLQANETKTFYVKMLLDIDSETVNFISISDTKVYNEQAIIDNLKQGIFHGLLWMMLFYNLFLYFSTWKKSYLYYVAYVFWTSIFQLQIFSYIKNIFFPELPEISSYFGISFFIAFIFYYLLMREFIYSRKNHPQLDKALKVIILINSIYTLTFFTIVLINNNLFSILSLVFGLLNMIALLVLTIIILKTGNKISKIFAIGTSFLVLGTLMIIIGGLLGINPEEAINYFQAGIVGEVFIFSVGLSYKYKITEQQKQKAQEGLIIQLKENQELHTKVNRELEQKVRERTAEINEQKEEIQSIADNLSEANTEISKKNKDITASIQYAKKIQTAMFPDDLQISKILPEHFILFKPRDIVSGDFYWIKEIDNNLIIAAADCTGHGVPGAFVSMLGISYLNEIVQRKEITQANQILNELRSQIKYSLKQHGQKDQSKDGMDLAICIIDTKSNLMQYAGAYNPLYLIRKVNGEAELKVIKADRMPVGFFHGKDKSFTNHEIQLEKGDTIYLFSDGFIDQFGGKNNSKFMSKNFRKLLLEIHEEPMYEQKEILNKTFKDWMKENTQIDDVLVVGVRV